MKKLLLIRLSVISLMTFVTIQTAYAQDKKEPWPGVTVKVLTENEKIKVLETTFTPGAFADWHTHPLHTIYFLTNANIKEEIKGNPPHTIEMKAGQAFASPAVTHKVTNVGNTPLTMIVTEVK